MATRTRKATFSLPEDTLMDLGEAVARGAASSKNAFVQRALGKELREWRRRELKAQWEEAMRDPRFLRDVKEVAAAFKLADAEGLPEN